MAAAKTAPRDTAAEVAFLTRALKAPTLRESVDRLAESGRSVSAKGADPDTLVASAKAYLGALNKLMSRRQKGQAEPLLAERRLHSTDVG